MPRIFKRVAFWVSLGLGVLVGVLTTSGLLGLSVFLIGIILSTNYIAKSVTGSVFYFNAVLGFLIGYYWHWLPGLIFFVYIVYHSLLPAIIFDTIDNTIEYHHDREDERARKILESEYYMRKYLK